MTFRKFNRMGKPAGKGAPVLFHLLHDRTGVTLTEVLIGMFILVVGLFGLAAVFDQVILRNAQSKEITIATIIAQQRLEVLKRRGITGAGYVNITSVVPKPVPGYPAFTMNTAVAAVDAAPVTPPVIMKDVTVTVTWGSPSRNVALKMILAPPPP